VTSAGNEKTYSLHTVLSRHRGPVRHYIDGRIRSPRIPQGPGGEPAAERIIVTPSLPSPGAR
jgi:hypothetical protein